MALGAPPDRQWRAPVARPRQGPVDVVVEPVAVASPLDVFGIPGGGAVLAQQGVLDLRGADVPRGLGVVEQRGVAAPAVGVGVLVGEHAEHQPTPGQVLDEHPVGGLEEHPADQFGVGAEGSVRLDRVDQRQPVLPADDHVVLAEGRRLVNQAGAVLGGDVLGHHDVVGAAHDVGELDQLEGTLVGPELQLPAGEGAAQPPAVAEHLFGQRLGDHEGLAAGDVVRGDHVADVGMDGHRGVADQRPGRGRPHQQGSLPRQGTGGQREPHVHRRVGDILVALGELVVAQRRAAARAVRRDPVVLDEQALGMDLLQRPPDRFDERGVHRPVGLVEVHPVAHAGGQLGEGADVAGDRFATLGVERLDPERLDVGLTVEAEFLLNRQFDGQAVAVPTGLALDVEALHGLEPREDVLEDAGLDVVRAGHAVRRGRTLVEGPRLAARRACQRGGKGVVGRPEVEDFVFHRGQVDHGRHRTVHRLVGLGWCHALPSSRAGRRDEAPVPGPAVPPSLDAGASHFVRCPPPVLVSAEAPFFRQLRGDGPLNAARAPDQCRHGGCGRPIAPPPRKQPETGSGRRVAGQIPSGDS